MIFVALVSTVRTIHSQAITLLQNELQASFDGHMGKQCQPPPLESDRYDL
jgi:hypothetical protein